MDSDVLLQALHNIEAWLESSKARKSKEAYHGLEDALKHLKMNGSQVSKCENFCQICCQNQISSVCSQSLALTSIVKDFEYLQRKLSKKLRRTSLLRNIAGRGCQILKAGLVGLKIANFVIAIVPFAEIVACIFVLIMAGEVALHLLQKCRRSLSCEEENLTELVRCVECVQHFLIGMIFD